MRSRSPEEAAQGVPNSPRQPLTVPVPPPRRGSDACPPVADPEFNYLSRSQSRSVAKTVFRIGVSKTAPRQAGFAFSPRPGLGA